MKVSDTDSSPLTADEKENIFASWGYCRTRGGEKKKASSQTTLRPNSTIGVKRFFYVPI